MAAAVYIRAAFETRVKNVCDKQGIKVAYKPDPRHVSINQLWEAIVDRYGLRAPRSLDAFVGQSFVYADLLLGYGRERVPMPQLVSTIKIRQAGFTDCVDSEADLTSWFERLRARRLIPPRAS